MSKKKISLIQAIIQLLTIGSLFIPMSFIRYYHNTFKISTYQYMESVIEATDMTYNLLWGILLLIFSAASLAYYILHFSTKLPQLRKKYCIAVSCLPIPFLIVIAIVVSNYVWRAADRSASEVYGIGWGFYLVCALYLSMVVLELFKHFSKLEEENKPRVSKTTIVQNASSADELKKYKELLDQGIISQEEFDAKKTQLLGL